MNTENELTNEINNLTSKIKTEYVLFHAGVLGGSKEDVILKMFFHADVRCSFLASNKSHDKN